MLSLTIYPAVQINLVLAWLWITLGFVAGAVMGFNFNFFDEGWLGGYATLKRRLYRLGHISFFGLAVVNLMFYFTVQTLTGPGQFVGVASWAFVIGAITMPLCCFTLAHLPKFKVLFYVPVISLMIGGLLTIVEVMQL